MLLERRTSAKMDLSLFTIRVNAKLTGFPSEELEHDLKKPSGFRPRSER